MWARIGVAALAALVAGCPDERPPDYFVAPPVPSVRVAPPAADAGLSPREEPLVVPPVRAPDVAVSPAPSADAGAAPAEVGPAPQPPLPSFAPLFRRLSPSVVNIYTQEIVRQRLADRLRPGDLVGTSLGSGMVLDRSGHIITNAHVVENATEIRVRFRDDDELPARVIGIDPVRDLALLKVDGKEGLIPVVAGDSDALDVGDWVIAIGNPFGLSHTLTKGIVSAKDRSEHLSEMTGYVDLIQTDAAINGGNSGGPLFNLDGEVVGVATAVSAQGQGISFAIPWNVVRAALPRLRQGGQVSRSWLGVFVSPAEAVGGGVMVDGVVNDSPADRAGLRPGDVVLSFDGRPAKSTVDFRLQVASGVAGRELSMEIRRGGRELTLSVRLAEARGFR